jgi:hypothetical protein
VDAITVDLEFVNRATRDVNVVEAVLADVNVTLENLSNFAAPLTVVSHVV